MKVDLEGKQKISTAGRKNGDKAAHREETVLWVPPTLRQWVSGPVPQ